MRRPHWIESVCLVFFFFFSDEGNTPENAHRLLLALNSGMIHGSALKTIWSVGDQTVIVRIQNNHLSHCTTSLVAELNNFNLKPVSHCDKISFNTLKNYLLP